MLVFDAKLIFGTSNFVVFYVSIKHVTCFLQGLHAIFTGEDDTWDAWLKILSSGFSGTVHFRGTGIKLRRGYAPSQSPKANPCIFLLFRGWQILYYAALLVPWFLTVHNICL